MHVKDVLVAAQIADVLGSESHMILVATQVKRMLAAGHIYSGDLRRLSLLAQT